MLTKEKKKLIFQIFFSQQVIFRHYQNLKVFFLVLSPLRGPGLTLPRDVFWDLKGLSLRGVHPLKKKKKQKTTHFILRFAFCQWKKGTCFSIFISRFIVTHCLHWTMSELNSWKIARFELRFCCDCNLTFCA